MCEYVPNRVLLVTPGESLIVLIRVYLLYPRCNPDVNWKQLVS